ncbi:MAG: DUF4040 domain-containing protein [Lachnospiraceae bacterium]|nr:DUF4040 domain-containing protein [Lachnospiraceae bacterium]
MTVFIFLILGFLIVCSVATCLHRTLFTSIIIFMAYSTVMSVVWAILESPDLAITEAAVGAGITSILFFVTLKKIQAVETMDEEPEGNEQETK